MRAKPIFTYSLIAGALAFAGPALALGLGKLTVDSALGQPLSARIELTSVSKDDLESLRAKVADPALYRQNNLTYQGTLSRTRIVLESAGGMPYLKVTSPVSVQEPFLDLLVELDWASGRVVREYTFLLDPPGMPAAASASEPIAPARAGTPAQTRAAPAPRSAAATTTGAAPAAASGRAGGNTYAVRRGDTLQRIATQNKPADVTLDQMLAALFRDNKPAFEGDNMNRLRAGTIITIPTAAQAQATPVPEAARVVHMQAADWRAYRDRVAAAAPESAGSTARESTGKIGATVQESTPAAPPGSDKLRVSRDAGAGKGGSAEDAIALGQQLRDAQARIGQLEKTLADMQRAVDLKSQTMSQIQSQAEAAKGTAPAGTPASVAVADASRTPAGVAPGAAAGVAQGAPAGTTAAATATAAAPSTSAPAAAPAAAPVEAPKAAETGGSAASPAASKAPPVAAPKAPVREPPGFFADLFSGTPSWAIGGGALVILGGIAAMIAARRNKGTKFEDSIISGTDIKTNTVFGSTGGGVVNTGDNSLSSDFSREGLGNIDTDEVDPIAEAEVYLAYGRDAQAEEILKDALKKDSQRQEIYLKLLEIHSQHNKPSAFETVASELFAVSHGQGDVWHKAVTLGRQLDPSNPMFQDGTAAAEAIATPAVAVPRSPLHDAPAFNDGDISIVPPASPAKSPADILAGAETALAHSTSTPVAAVEEATRRHAVETAGAATAALAGTLAATQSSFDAGGTDLSHRVDSTAEPLRFDLDFQLDDAERPAALKPIAETRQEPALTPTPSQLTRPAPPLELDKLDLSFDPTRPAFDDPSPSVLDGQWHDAATKLDLAKAYQEMGDVEGAREILQEVLHEGDDGQKSEAQALLAKLG